MSVVGLVMIATGLIMALLGVPLWLQRVPPNSFYGFRTPRTVSDPEVWYPVNRISGRDLTLGGGIGALAALICDLLLVDPVQSALVLMACVLVPVTAAVLHTFWAASTFVAEHDARAEKGGAARRSVPQRESER